MSRPVPNMLPSADPGPVRLALVGEAPGEVEAQTGRPFAGPSGYLLDQWLASAGLSRSQCFVGNVAQVRPSEDSNDFHLFEWNEARVQEGIAALRADLAAFRPNCVVALGNAALHLLRHGNAGVPKSKVRRLFQWTSHVGTWRGSLFAGASDFDPFTAADLRLAEGQRGLSFSGSKPVGPTCETGSGPVLEVGGSHLFLPAVAAPFNGNNGGAYDNATGKAGQPAGGVPVDILMSPASFSSTAPANPLNVSSAANPSSQDERGNLAAVIPWKCLSTYHPAATFRDPSFTYPLVSDLKRAVAEARSPLLDLPRRNIVWGLSAAEIEARIACIRERREPVGFDIEGGPRGLQCCSFATSPTECFVIDLMALGADGPAIYRALSAVLEDPRVPKVCWNAAYERAILEMVASIRLQGYEDGMLAWWERFSELPKGLDFVASLLTREPYWAEGIGWDRKTGAPRVTGPPFWRYNGTDSCVTLEIWQHPLVKAVVEARQPVAFETASSL